MVRAVETDTGEIIELDRTSDQQRLFGGHDSVEEYELAIVGASGLEGHEDLTIGQAVELRVRGVVREITHKIRELPTGREVLVRVAKIKATGATVIKERR